MPCLCWTWRGSIGGKEGSKLELREKDRPDRLECPDCEQDRAAKDLGPLVLPVPTKRELVAALVSAPDDPWWEDACRTRGSTRRRAAGCDLLVLAGVEWLLMPCCLDLWLDLMEVRPGCAARVSVTMCDGWAESGAGGMLWGVFGGEFRR